MSESTNPAEPLDLDEIEGNLRAEQTELRGRMRDMTKTPERGSQVSFGKRIGDGTTEAISRITEVGVHAKLQDNERRITRALEKIEDGTYGVCDSCENPIPAGRLRVVPQSVLCMDCAKAEGR